MSKNNSRRYPGETSKCRPDFAEERRQEAAARQEKYNALSAKEKLQNLDLKFGVGGGAAKQRAKLLAEIQNPGKKVVATKEDLATATLPEDIMAEIDAMNEESGKRKLKAKDRRARGNKSGT
jgi:hypothetical protein